MPDRTTETTQTPQQAPESQTNNYDTQADSTATTASIRTPDINASTRFYLMVPRLKYTRWLSPTLASKLETVSAFIQTYFRSVSSLQFCSTCNTRHEYGTVCVNIDVKFQTIDLLLSILDNNFTIIWECHDIAALVRFCSFLLINETWLKPRLLQSFRSIYLVDFKRFHILAIVWELHRGGYFEIAHSLCATAKKHEVPINLTDLCHSVSLKMFKQKVHNKFSSQRRNQLFGVFESN